MQNKFILTDGQKSVDLLDSDDPRVWTFFSNAPNSTQDMLYARVSAAFRAYNLKANTVGSMPFTLTTENGEEYDNSATWENKVGFLPNPSELFRLNTLSYMSTNTIYNLRTTDALGYKVKGMYHAVATTFTPFVNSGTQQVDYIERRIGAHIERYQMEDKRLVRMWRLDHTTELLPSPNTEAKAIMNAAGEVFYADLWIKHFYERGGVAPTVIAMKGAVAPDKKNTEEQSWTDWLLGLGRWRARIVRVFNTDTLEVKQFGSSVTDLKNNETYTRAITNIAMGTGMPLSLLMANSANYATAKEEKATWYENDIIPFCSWMEYHYNEQVFHPMGLSMQFHPETLDPQQEDETERAQAINTFIDFLAKCPTLELFIGTCDTFGYELSDSLRTAAEAYYNDKEDIPEGDDDEAPTGTGVPVDGMPVAQDLNTVPALTLNGAQISSAVAIVQAVAEGRLPREAGIGQLQTLVNLTPEQAELCMGSVGQSFTAPPRPAPVPFGGGKPVADDDPDNVIDRDGEQPAEAEADDGEEDKKPFGKGYPMTQEMVDDIIPPVKWTPSLDQLRELQRWQELAFRKLKRAEPLDFEWRNDTLPEDVYNRITEFLPASKSEWDVKELFDVIQLESVTQAKEDDGMKYLADSINRMAEAMMVAKA